MKINDQEIVLFAWIGDDEFGSGRVGLKQALSKCGMCPLVVMDFDRNKIDNNRFRTMLGVQAEDFGKKIRLVKLEVTEVIFETEG